MTSLQHIDEQKADARYQRRRLDLYRAKVYGPRPTSPSRLKELERVVRRSRDGSLRAPGLPHRERSVIGRSRYSRGVIEGLRDRKRYG